MKVYTYRLAVSIRSNTAELASDVVSDLTVYLIGLRIEIT